MTPRLDPKKVAPGAYNAMLTLEKYVRECGIDPALADLLRMRASQINGCAYCLDMHSKDARKEGVSEQKLYVLDGWRHSPAYSARERAALAWTEALTLIAETGAPDDVYDELRRHFSEAEIVNLSLLIVTINAWNRLVVGSRIEHPVAQRAAA
ncbi:MAG TPA: carboxymuconolactone decarboxylase family protein [Stellaceae bacterium]|nr:carboxymuconolactone decarboxylase family protein [Stellaceae bacterium]